jgi:circadian clock protein KaiC
VAGAKKLSTGTSGLDLLLGGGIPKATVLLLEGPPGIGKRELGCRFLKQGIADKEPVSLVYRGYGPNDVGAYSESGEECPKPITLIECSGSETAPADIRCNVSELFTVLDAIKRHCKAKPNGRLVVDVLSDMSMIHTPQQIYHFLTQLIMETKATGTTCVLIIDEGMQDPTTLVGLEHSCDAVVQLRLWEEKLSITPVIRVKKTNSEKFDREYFVYEKLKEGVKMVKGT